MILNNLLSFIPNFITDAFKDSVSLLPFLFFIFLFIEIFENFFSKKISFFLKYSKKVGPIFGAFFAIIPQCGFSVIATLFYLRRFISLGTLISVYIATSDEAIPVLLTVPEKFPVVCKIIVIKLILAILAGYSVDILFKEYSVEKQQKHNDILDFEQHGCCNHDILHDRKIFGILIHPIKHTFFIFCFIFGACLLLNALFEFLPSSTIEKIMLQNSMLQPVFAGLFGLIPNCAVSVLITMMFLKNILSFGSVISGLSASAGLGLLVLFNKNKDIKNNFLIIVILLSISIFAGIIIQLI